MSDNAKFVIRSRAIILHEGKMLVVRHAPDAKFLALPGGHLELGEDVKECLVREIEEELGIKPELGRLLYVHTFTDKWGVQPVEFFFEVTNGKDYLDIEKFSGSHAAELSEILWVSPDSEVTILPKKLGEDFRAGNMIGSEVQFIKQIEK